MYKINKVASVTERDIDLLLLEELNVSNEFSRWFYSTVTRDNDDSPSVDGAWHSVTDPALGESDLVVTYQNGTAILIENKIDAIAQPEQGNRYRARGELGVKDGAWDRFITCMVAPKLYIQKERDSQVYDSQLSYEEISDWFLSRGDVDKRSAHKSYLINEAIEQNRRGYTVNPDDRVTEFWLKYWALSSHQYPDLEMKKPGIKPANSDWPDFHPTILGKDLTIVHKLERGDVDLQISGAAEKIDDLKQLLADFEVEITTAGKSAAIRLKVESINRFASFESQEDIVIDGLNKARNLLVIAKELPEI